MTTTPAAKRPAAITGISVIGLVGVITLSYFALSGQFDGAPDWYLPYLTASAIVGLTAMAGLFLMRRWGFYLYAGLFLVNQLVLFSTGLWSLQSALVPAVVIAVAARHLGAMR